MQALPEVRGAVPADFPVLIDGGFRRGSDVLKALALGARMVFTGRPQLFGAAVGGVEGIRRAVQIFDQEILTDMALLGCASLDEVDRSVLRTVGQTLL